MNKLTFCVIKLVLIICSVVLTVKCSRKYDVYTESLKLYGEELTLILRRFRKTPEYLAILNTRIKQFKIDYEDTFSQISHDYERTILGERIEKFLNESEGHEGQKRSYRKAFFQSDGYYRADEEPSTSTSTMSPIEVLDTHVSSKGSVAERNSFKNICFEVAGDAIHKIIESMGPEEESDFKSTKMPSGKVTTTTEHATFHEVTSEPKHPDHAEHSSARFRASAYKVVTSPGNLLQANSSSDKFHSMSDRQIS